MSDEGIVVFQCQCELPKHQFNVQFRRPIWHNEDRTKWWEPELWLSMCLNSWLPWYKRIWVAMLYVLGFDPPRWDPFDTTMLKPEDAAALKHVLENYLRQLDEFNRRMEGP